MYFYELLLVVFIVLLSLKFGVKKVLKSNKRIVFFLSWIIFTLLISFFFYAGFENIVAVLYALRLGTYFVYFVLVKEYLHENKAANKFWYMATLFFLGLTIVFSLVQYFLYPNIGNLAYLGWDPHLYRIVGLYFEPQLAIAVYGLLFFYIINLKPFARNRKLSNTVSVPDSVAQQPQKMSKSPHLFGSPRFATPVPLLLLTILLVMMILTISRGGIIAFVITLLLVFRKKLKLITLSLLIITAIFIAVPKPQSEGLNIFRTASIQTRLIDYQKAFKIWQKSPIIGIGYNHIRFEKDRLEENILTNKYNPSHASSSFHSSFLIILVTTGVVGLVIYLWLLWSLAKISDFSMYATLFLAVTSIFDNVLLHPFVLFLYFTLIALTQITHPSRELR